MTLEKEIEDKIVEYLKGCIDNVGIEAFNTYEEEVIARAKRQPEGLIVVTHANNSVNYEDPYKAGIIYNLELKYAVTILMNSRRDNNGLYDMLDTVRAKLINFRYKNQVTRLVSHAISPQRAFDYKEGVFTGELVIAINAVYPSEY